MSNLKYAAKLALEALVKMDAALRKAWDDRILPASVISYADINANQDAIKALEEALAKQEGQSNFCPNCEALARELKAIKQEQGEVQNEKK